MNILGTRDLEATRKKLRLLEEHYRAVTSRTKPTAAMRAI